MVEKIAVVLVARGRREWRVFNAAPALYRDPRHGEGSRVLYKDRNVDRPGIGCDLPTLHDVELFGMRRAVVVDKGLGRDTDGVDDERIAVLVVPNRLAIPRGFQILRMHHVEIDAANLRCALIDDHDLLCSLDAIERLDQRIRDEARYTDRPAAFARAKRDLACQDFLIRLLHRRDG